jgi:hypothetical protein
MARDRGFDRSLVGYTGVICKRRRRGGTEAGVWPALHALLDGPRPPGSCTWLIAGGVSLPPRRSAGGLLLRGSCPR